MKSLKTSIFSITLLGTTFVALGYFCKRCGIDHEWPGECIVLSCDRSEGYDTMFKEDFDRAIKDKISHCRNAGEARRIIGEINSLLDTKEREIRLIRLLPSPCKQRHIDEIRKLIKEVSKAMENHCISYKNCGSLWDDEVLNWEEVFGSDCKSAPDFPNHEDSWNESSGEHDPWDSGYAYRANSTYNCNPLVKVSGNVKSVALGKRS